MKTNHHFVTGVERCELLHQQFIDRVRSKELPEVDTAWAKSSISKQESLNVFHSQLMSRHLDYYARKLKQQNRSYYTIGSAGHEGSAAIAQVLRLNDMAFLHYRSGAFMLERARKIPEMNMVKDMLLSLMASRKDSISQGRHKVLGSLPLFVPPQTSTIASHLPKAVGMAAAIARAKTTKISAVVPHDSIVICSFGDASVNHATALSAFNTAQWIVKKKYPLPIIFLCEDNGLGISVSTPDDWIESMYSGNPYMHYIQADGLDIVSVYEATTKAEWIARVEKKPVFLHVKCVRLLGHAGVDYEPDYREISDIEKTEAQDPLLYSAAILLKNEILTAEEILLLDSDVVDTIETTLTEIGETQGFTDAEDLMSCVVPPAAKRQLPALPSQNERQKLYAKRYVDLSKKLNLSQQINFALADIMAQYNNVIVFGEDVALKGGVYKVTKDLANWFGPSRVFDTLLDETTILGQAIGHAHNGFIPIPEIQFLAYLHNAEDQLRSEAATLSFFSAGQYVNPMVIRVASFAYQKGFGGHFHNDNSFSVLRDLPGVIIACPSNGADAVKMLRHCVELAYVQGRVVVFMEPIALYMQKDLHESGDQLWLSDYPTLGDALSLDELGVRENGNDAVIVTYGNGFYLSCRAQKMLSEKYNINIKVIDLRWLAPVNYVELFKHIGDIQHILVVDECRQTASISEAIVTKLNQLEGKNIGRVTAADCFIPLGKSWHCILPDEQDIVAAIHDFLGNKPSILKKKFCVDAIE